MLACTLRSADKVTEILGLGSRFHESPAALAAASDELALPEGPAAGLRTVDAAVEAAEQDLAGRRARDDDRLAEWLQKCASGRAPSNSGTPTMPAASPIRQGRNPAGAL